jgi:hypothetical protein
MSARITVIIPVAPQAPHLRGLVSSLDAQTVPYDAVDVVLLTTSPDSAQRLRGLERQRPNLEVRPVSELGTGRAELQETLTTPWVLTIPAGERPVRLPPRALETLVTTAEREGADWVAGRRFAVGEAEQIDCYVADRVVAGTPGEAGPAGEPAGSLVLRSSAPSGSGRGAVVGSYPCLSLPPSAGERHPGTSAHPLTDPPNTTLAWSGPTLRIDVTGVLSGAASYQLCVSVSQPASGLDFWLPTTATVDAGGGFRVAAALSPATAGAGEALGRGVWQLWLTAVDSAARGYRLRLQGEPPGGAVLDGRLVGSPRQRGPLLVDLDATKHPVLPDLDAATATVVESAAGSRVTLPVPALHVHGEAVVLGALLQDGFALPARLAADPRGSRIECLLSGVVGTRALGIRFGGNTAHPTGLALEIAPTGEMRVVPQPPVPAPPVLAPPGDRPEAGSAAPERDGKPSAVTRMRRRLPAFLEPAAGRLSRNRTARRIYRELIKRVS